MKAIDQSESALLNQGRLSRELQDGLMARAHGAVLERRGAAASRGAPEREGALQTREPADRAASRPSSIAACSSACLRRSSICCATPCARHRAGSARAARASPMREITIELRHEATKRNRGRDDGGGLDLEASRAAAQERGILPPIAAVVTTPARRVIFMPGFSTAADVTLAAGRGVGMDVVKNDSRGRSAGASTSSSSRPRHALHHPTAAYARRDSARC